MLDTLPELQASKYATLALKWAVAHDDMASIESLLGRGARDDNAEALQMARIGGNVRIERALLWKFAPKLAGPTNPEIQDEFDRLWVEATMIEKQNVRDAGTGDDAMFVKRHVYERLAATYKLEPEDFAKLEMEFHRNWRPSFAEGWVRFLNHPKATTIIEADAILADEFEIGLVEWELANLSACLVEYAVKRGLRSADIDSIRSRAKEKHPTAGERRRVLLEALNILLAEYNQPNTYAPNKPLVERAKDSVAGLP